MLMYSTDKMTYIVTVMIITRELRVKLVNINVDIFNDS